MAARCPAGFSVRCHGLLTYWRAALAQVESKSRKTRFLADASRSLSLAEYVPLTQNVNELARSWVFDVDVVTAKGIIRPCHSTVLAEFPCCHARWIVALSTLVTCRVVSAFKPLPEVAPIARRCILHDAQMLVPISAAQVREFSLSDEQLSRYGAEHVYYNEVISPSRGAEQRKLVTAQSAKSSRL